MSAKASNEKSVAQEEPSHEHVAERRERGLRCGLRSREGRSEESSDNDGVRDDKGGIQLLESETYIPTPQKKSETPLTESPTAESREGVLETNGHV
jgi:hypothetical protein